MRRHALLLLFALAAMSSFAQDPMTPTGPPYRVGGDVKAPVVLSRVEPIYPAEARANRVSGIVIVEAVITREGAVRDVKVLKPLPYGLDQAAVDALKQWTFRPGTRNGEPVDVYFNLTMNFKLDGTEEEPGRPLAAPRSRTQLTTVILVRHAEKGAAPADDPALTSQGMQRAESLARMLANTPVTAIYTTPYTRTRETAAPLAAAKSLTPIEVPVSAAYPRDVVGRIHEQRGGTYVVVGHSNTTRDVLRALGITDAKDIPDSEYDNLYILTFAPFTEPKVVSLKY